MPADPIVLAALVKALESDPGSIPLRFHLAELLLEDLGWKVTVEDSPA